MTSPRVELQGKKVYTLVTEHKANPNGHYLSFMVRQDKLKENRDTYVRVMAALIEAARFIRDPKNADRVGEDATPTGHSKEVSKATIKPLIDIDYWPADYDGLDQKRFEYMFGVVQRTGGIQPGKAPANYDRLTDNTRLSRRAGHGQWRWQVAAVTGGQAGNRRGMGSDELARSAVPGEPARRSCALGNRRALHQPGLPGAASRRRWLGSGRSPGRLGHMGAIPRLRRRLFLTGFALALVVGMPAGLLFSRVSRIRVGIEPYIMILYATPMVALIPFILSLMGFGFGPKVLVVFLFAVFPILYNTVEGARSIKPELIEVARSFRSSEWALWREVMLPYTCPTP